MAASVMGHVGSHGCADARGAQALHDAPGDRPERTIGVNRGTLAVWRSNPHAKRPRFSSPALRCTNARGSDRLGHAGDSTRPLDVRATRPQVVKPACSFSIASGPSLASTLSMNAIFSEMRPTLRRCLVIASLLALATPVVGCDSPPSEEQTDQSPTSASSDEQLRAIVNHYEAIRRKLLNDETSGIKDEAEKIAALSSKSANPASAAIGQIASQLSGKAGDLEAVRLAFGELSQRLIEALANNSQLKEELHLFNCPMARGYGQWVQSDAKLGNPYMGQSMPGCGSHAEW